MCGSGRLVVKEVFGNLLWFFWGQKVSDELQFILDNYYTPNRFPGLADC